MLLQCEIQDGDASGGAAAACSLRASTLESLFELNESCLTLFAEQARRAAARRCPARSPSSGGCWMPPAAAVRPAATTWCSMPGSPTRAAGSGRHPSRVPPRARRYFTVPGTAALVQAVCVFGWHLARCQGSAAQLLLGMPAPCVNVLAQRTLGQVRSLATAHPEWLRPRWLRQPRVWRELLAAARSDDPAGAVARPAARADPAGGRNARLRHGACAAAAALGPAAGARGPPAAIAATAGACGAALTNLQSQACPFLSDACLERQWIPGMERGKIQSEYHSRTMIMKQALLVIDAQESFRSRPYFNDAELPGFLRNTQSLIDRCQAQGIAGGADLPPRGRG